MLPGMSDPTISAQFLRHVVNCLELTGRSPDPLLQRYGLTRGDLDDPEAMIPLADWLAIFEDAADYARNPHFGLYVGRLAGSDSLGPLSFLFLSAPTLRTAFASFTRYLDTMQQAARNVFFEDGRSATFEYAVLDQSMVRRRQDAEYSIGATFTLARLFTGGDLVMHEVHFEHERSGDYARYRDYFGCDVFFEQDRNSFSFDAGQLDASGRVLSSTLHPILEDHLRRRSLEAGGEHGLVEEVKTRIAAAPLDRPPTIAEMAALLDMSVPTLNRKLRGEGASWRALLAEHRMQAAARLLRESRRSIGAIALALGYAESASFIRSFQRCFGTTPSQFRQTSRNGNPRP